VSDIFFKCNACGNHLVVDEARRGMTVECPKCDASIAVPRSLSIRQCPRCGQRIMIGPAMKGELVHCSSCHEVIRTPGQATGSKAKECSAVFICPKCHAEVEALEEISNRPTSCPSCGEQVYFRDPLGPRGNLNVGPPKPKGYDEYRFRKKSG